MLTQFLNDQGYPTLRLQYHECLKSPGRDVPKKIRQGEIIGICVAFHEWKKRIPKELISRFLKEIGAWIKHSCNLGAHFAIVGLTGDHWNQMVFEQAILAKKLHVSKHRFCAMNIKLRDVDAPSNLCVKVLSTYEVPSTPYTCGVEFKDHVNDWRPCGSDKDRINHRDAMTLCYSKLIELNIFQFHAPDDAEHLFPTDERIEWKRKRKENKEKGIEVKKRTKAVEAHFDDCGDDLSGLGPDVKETMMFYSFENDYDFFVEGLCTQYWSTNQFNST